MRASILAAVMAAAAVAIAVVLLFVTMAHGHENIGHFTKHGLTEFLYGIKVDDDTQNVVNCCKFEGEPAGDCRRLADSEVKVVPGGFIWLGHFIPYSRTNISPLDPVTGEYDYYGCVHPPNGGWGENPRPHCFFHPPNGS